jgi:hypothetical protein
MNALSQNSQNPIWWIAERINRAGSVREWQERAIRQAALNWEHHPLQEFMLNVLIVLPVRIVLFLLLYPVSIIALAIASLGLARAPFTMLGRWYWFAYLVSQTRLELRRSKVGPPR